MKRMNDKLNKATKDQIQARLMSGQFEDRAKDIVDAYAEIARVLYCRRYDARDRAWMEEVPEGWLPKVSAVWVNVQGHSREIPFNGVTSMDLRRLLTEQPENVTRPIADCHKTGNALQARAVPADDDVAHQLEDADRRASDLLVEHRRLARDIRAVLDTVSTFNRLHKVWPEVWDKVSDLVDDRSANAGLPAKQINELNEELHLT